MKMFGHLIAGLCLFCILSPMGCVMDEAPDDKPDLTTMKGEAGDWAVAGDLPVTAVAPPCYGSGCNGRNPATTGCANTANGPVYTLQSKSIMNGTTAVGGVELRYSQWCNARWSRTISYIGNKCIGAIMRDSTDSYDIAGTNTYVCNNSDVFGNMYGGVVARAKGYLYMSNTDAKTYREAVTNAQ
jgi:hypothetical protein